MIKRMALAIFLFSISTPAMALTYREIAKACYQYRKQVSISDCVACARDTIEYCSHLKESSDLEQIGKCLRQNMDKLKPACQKVIQRHIKPTLDTSSIP